MPSSFPVFLYYLTQLPHSGIFLIYIILFFIVPFFRNFYLREVSPNSGSVLLTSSDFLRIKQIKQSIRNYFSTIILYPLDYLQVHHEGLFQQIVQLKRTVFSRLKYMVNKEAVPDWVTTELGELAKIEPNLGNFRKAQIRKKRPDNINRKG